MHPQDWQFKEEVPEHAIYSQEFWYDITLGGYILPEELLEDQDQIKKLNEALRTLQSFEEALELIRENLEDE